MAKVELKQPIVEEIKASLDGAKGVVLVDHRGLTVEQDTVLRKSLREAGVTYKVYKNTLVKRAIEGTEFESLKDLLEGPSAIAISKSEATTPASIICKFAKTNDKLEVKGGVVEGAFYDAKGSVHNPVQRRTSCKVPWKHPVSDHQFCSCYQADRREAGSIIWFMIGIWQLRKTAA